MNDSDETHEQSQRAPVLALFGATSQEGQAVARAFLNQGWKVQALTRNRVRAQGCLPLRLEWIEGTLEQARDIETTLEGAHAVYFALGVCPFSKNRDFQPLREGLGTALMIAKRLQIHRGGIRLPPWVDPLATQSGHWVIDLQKEAVKMVDLGLDEAQIFSSTFWFEDWMQGLFCRQNQVFFDSGFQAMVRPMALKEWSEQVASVFSNPESLGSRVWEMQGAAAIPVKQIASHWVATSSRDLKLRDLGLPLFSLRALWNPYFRLLRTLYRRIHTPPVESLGVQRTWMELGKPKVTLENLNLKS
jgi:hypothetical protein